MLLPAREDIYTSWNSIEGDEAEREQKLCGKGNCLEEVGLSEMRVSGNGLA
jgi:hypothetical protein